MLTNKEHPDKYFCSRKEHFSARLMLQKQKRDIFECPAAYRFTYERIFRLEHIIA